MLNDAQLSKRPRVAWPRKEIVRNARHRQGSDSEADRPDRLRRRSRASRGVARRERNCSVARTLDIVSDAWAFLIIREAFFGTQTFEAFRSALGIPRATLDRSPEEADAARHLPPGRDRRSSQRKEYRLTKMGFDLYPSFIALMQFGDRWLVRRQAASADADSRELAAATVIPSSRAPTAAKSVTARDVEVPRRPRRRPPSREARPQHQTRLRRKPLPARATELGFARAADHRRQMELHGRPRGLLRQSALRQDPDRARDRAEHPDRPAVAPGREGVFYRRQYQSSPDRYEYLLTDMGRDLYGPFIAMLAWGDRWLSKGKPPLLLTHLICGHDFHAEVDLRPLQAANRRRRHAVPAGLRSQVLRSPGSAVGRLTSSRTSGSTPRPA